MRVVVSIPCLILFCAVLSLSADVENIEMLIEVIIRVLLIFFFIRQYILFLD